MLQFCRLLHFIFKKFFAPISQEKVHNCDFSWLMFAAVLSCPTGCTKAVIYSIFDEKRGERARDQTNLDLYINKTKTGFHYSPGHFSQHIDREHTLNIVNIYKIIILRLFSFPCKETQAQIKYIYDFSIMFQSLNAMPCTLKYKLINCVVSLSGFSF